MQLVGGMGDFQGPLFRNLQLWRTSAMATKTGIESGETCMTRCGEIVGLE